MKFKIGKTTFVIDEDTIYKYNIPPLETEQADLIYKTPSFYRGMEIKNNLDIENEGSSKKIIKDILENKLTPTNDNQRLLVNLDNIHNILQRRPEINIENLRLLNDNMWFNISSENKLEIKEYPWRKNAGVISSGNKDFQTLDPEYLDETMTSLFDFINSTKLQDKLIAKSLIVMFWFVYAHPFYDYNGKMSRILGSWFLLNNNMVIFSMVFSLGFKCMRSNYFDDLKKIRLEEMKKAETINITNIIMKWRTWLLFAAEGFLSYDVFRLNNGMKLNDTKATIYIALKLMGEFKKQSEFTQKDLEKVLQLQYDPKYLNKILAQMAQNGLINKRKQTKSPVYSILREDLIK